MNHDFIQIKMFEGDLKLSLKKHDYGVTVTTKQLILQKPHMNYIMKLEDIISIVPFELKGKASFSLTNKSAYGHEVTNISVATQHYKLFVQQVTVHNRSGIFEMGSTEFIMPIIDEMLLAISKYGQLNMLAD